MLAMWELLFVCHFLVISLTANILFQNFQLKNEETEARSSLVTAQNQSLLVGELGLELGFLGTEF